MMSHYIIKNRIKTPKGIKGFNYEDYAFDESLSTDTNFVFTR